MSYSTTYKQFSKISNGEKKDIEKSGLSNKMVGGYKREPIPCRSHQKMGSFHFFNNNMYCSRSTAKK
jgi:hypothetical protein